MRISTINLRESFGFGGDKILGRSGRDGSQGVRCREVRIEPLWHIEIWGSVCLFVCLFVWSSLSLIHELRVRGGVIVTRLIHPNHLGWVVWRRFRKFWALLHLVIIRSIINSSELRSGTRYMGMRFTRTWRISRLCRRRFIVSTASDNGTVCKP